MTETIEIRRLTPDDAMLYREIRLESLRTNPEAFGSTFEREAQQPLEWFAERLESATVFGAFRAGHLAGIAGFFREQSAKRAHIAILWGMYVREKARNRGVGESLVQAVIECAEKEVEVLHLGVISENAAARRLYTSAGFVEYGLERRAFKQHGVYYDEVWMAKMLQGDDA